MARSLSLSSQMVSWVVLSVDVVPASRLACSAAGTINSSYFHINKFWKAQSMSPHWQPNGAGPELSQPVPGL